MMQAKKVKLTPADNRLIVHVQDEVYTGKIFIPDTVKEKPTRGTVLANGPGKRKEGSEERVPCFFKVGDTVLFGKYSGTELKIDGMDVRLICEDDIMAKIEEVA